MSDATYKQELVQLRLVKVDSISLGPVTLRKHPDKDKYRAIMAEYSAPLDADLKSGYAAAEQAFSDVITVLRYTALATVPGVTYSIGKPGEVATGDRVAGGMRVKEDILQIHLTVKPAIVFDIDGTIVQAMGNFAIFTIADLMRSGGTSEVETSLITAIRLCASASATKETGGKVLDMMRAMEALFNRGRGPGSMRNLRWGICSVLGDPAQQQLINTLYDRRSQLAHGAMIASEQEMIDLSRIAIRTITQLATWSNKPTTKRALNSWIDQEGRRLQLS